MGLSLALLCSQWDYLGFERFAAVAVIRPRLHQHPAGLDALSVAGIDFRNWGTNHMAERHFDVLVLKTMVGCPRRERGAEAMNGEVASLKSYSYKVIHAAVSDS